MVGENLFFMCCIAVRGRPGRALAAAVFCLYNSRGSAIF